MQKALIIGSPGSGKSTFARALHEATGLPLIHLDNLFWNADKTNVEKEVFLARLEDALQRERWIIDGNYLSTMDKRLAACDTVFFLDYPVDVCLEGIRQRQGQPRPDMPWVEQPDECDQEFLAMIHNFPAETRPKVLALLAKYPDKVIVTLTSREEARAYLSRYQ